MPATLHLGAAVLVAALAASAYADQPRILCIGDSITQGGRADRDESTYRLPLQAMLNRAGIDYDFIGTRRAGLQPEAMWPAWFDPDHEGYYGARTAEVRDQLRVHLQALPAPDVALVALGTNDRDGGFVQPLEDIVRLLRAKNPHIAILVGHIALDGWAASWQRFRVERMVERLDTPSSRVVAVDHHAGWQPNPGKAGADTYDGVHPNAKGQLGMARRWFEAMRPYLKSGGLTEDRFAGLVFKR